jgi:Mg-chelatase subunit ChlD
VTPGTSRQPTGNAPAMGHARPPATGISMERAQDQKGLLRIGLWSGADDEIDEQEEEETGPADQRRREAAVRAGRSRLRAVESPAPYRGRYARARSARAPVRDVAWDATLLKAAQRGGPAPRIEVDDLLTKVRMRRPAQLLLFVVDGSGSMGGQLTDYARQIAASALGDAYLKRAAVAMIVFREQGAELLVGATRKVDLLERAFEDLQLGGTTPLASALGLARRTLERELARDRGSRPTLILISDGRANVGSAPGHEGMLAEVRSAAKAIAGLRAVRVLFLDTTEPAKDARRAAALADWLGADRIPLARHTKADPAALAKRALRGWSTP